MAWRATGGTTVRERARGARGQLAARLGKEKKNRQRANTGPPRGGLFLTQKGNTKEPRKRLKRGEGQRASLGGY